MVVTGGWRSPLVSKRVAAMLRKKAIKDGTYGSFQGKAGGWDPAWDTFKKPIIRRPHKMKIKERTREARFQRIQGKLAEQPEKLKEYRQSVRDAKPKPGIATLYKRLLTRRG